MTLFWLQLNGELRKLFARKRTHLGFVVFGGVALLMPLLLELPKVKNTFRLLIEQRGRSFDEYFSGLTIAFLTMRATILLIGALYVALVAGDIVAKEVEEGTIRMLLSRPISRVRLLGLKYLSAACYTAVLIVFIGLCAVATGFAYERGSGILALGAQEQIFVFHPLGAGFARYLSALPLLFVSLLTITSTAFCFSCFEMKPAAASVSTMSIFFVDIVFRSLPFFESIEPYFITSHMSAWMQVFQLEIPWPRIIHDFTLLLAADATLFVLGWMNFETRDFKT
ncbi:MAG: type transport system permease protein [Chthoniobacter sp.]|jgi:ABC-2 type transport system permease protein|nr:type transport system permease protein [Chthoniobacter sp.]